LKEEALDRTMWRARFGRSFGPVVRQTTELLNSLRGSYRRDGTRTLFLPRDQSASNLNNGNILKHITRGPQLPQSLFRVGNNVL
jgi:hypothetical protein